MNKKLWSTLLLLTSETLLEQSNILTDIDSKFGDGDHGIAMQKIAILMQSSVEKWNDESIRAFFDGLGDAVTNMGGGSAGPLYGSLLGGLALGISDDDTDITGPQLKAMLNASLTNMQTITTATIGDKTMMDAFIPAVTAANSASDDVGDIFRSASDAAQMGAKASEAFIAKFGRAKLYKEQTIGTPDAGASSTALLFKGLAKHFISLCNVPI